ncbi:amino acid ABC transporter ATP-binding/permease protein [Paracoccus tegillarcae]|uniref:ABC transporter n=1 Tax=Paracoccus tegillarcae TaxID=1529068 RepID=A0A2K9F4Q7_9RHOB|nr:ATP-binding cassette domain-containing protein [Paracoccus tegillarcae]AUH34131.1 ABC transporter [Paracoccus tegillarcae]
MSALIPFFTTMWRDQRWALLRGLLLSLVVLLAGVGLLGLSGWFVTAAGIAGLAGAGAMFDVFRPGAGVRFLALGRTAARYGERLLTHDATLRVLADWRVRLLGALTAAPFAVQARLRGGVALNRITSDVDALDSLAIRLVFPMLAGLGSVLIAALLMWWLVLPAVALWLLISTLAGVGLTVLAFAGPASRQAERAEAARQSLRAGMIDHLRGRLLLVVEGRLPRARDRVLEHDRQARQAVLRLAGIEIAADAAMQLLTTVIAAGTLLIAGYGVLDGRIGAAQAALAFFAALAMAEILMPLSRAIAELGRMRGAAARLTPLMQAQPRQPLPAVPAAPRGGLVLRQMVVGRDDRPLLSPVNLHVRPGETVALVGRSGVGKTTLLDAIAGLSAPLSGQICMGGGMQDEATLRQSLGYLTQRPALTSGCIADTLRLADPEATDQQMTQVLQAVSLPLPLDRLLGEAGQGLSGGEARRLALARALIRKPEILLLDEPTEGLDAATATAVLGGIRAYLPDAAVLIASHRQAERRAADRVVEF